MPSPLLTVGQQCIEINATVVNSSAVVIQWPGGTEPSEYQVTYNGSTVHGNFEISHSYTSQWAGVLISGLNLSHKHCFWVMDISSRGGEQGSGASLCQRNTVCNVSQSHVSAGSYTHCALYRL